MLQGKRALVVGVANARSIAWAVADRWHREGADVFVTYQNERFRKPVEKLVRERWGPFESDSPLPAVACDVSNDDEIAALWQTLHERGFCSRSPTESPDGTLALSTLGPGDQPLTEAKTNSDPSGKPESQEMSRLQVGVRPNIDSSAGDDDDERGGESCDGRRGEDQQGLQAQPKIDAILHSVAHAPTESMQEGFVTGTTRDAFISAHVVSAYSLVATARHALPFLAPGASVIALTYIGSQRAVPNYNVMGPAKASLESCARALASELGGTFENPSSPSQSGPGGVRVNCISPGPVRTMAARGISGFDEMRQGSVKRAPLGRSVELEEIAAVATFLASPLASSVTGQTLYADCGFSAMV